MHVTYNIKIYKCASDLPIVDKIRDARRNNFEMTVREKKKKNLLQITAAWPVNDFQRVCFVCKTLNNLHYTNLLRFPSSVTGRSNLFCAGEGSHLADVSCGISVFSCHMLLPLHVIRCGKARQNTEHSLSPSATIKHKNWQWFARIFWLDTQRDISSRRLGDTEQLVGVSFVLHIRETRRPVYLRIFIVFHTISI